MTDVSEIEPPSAAIKAHLAELLRASHVNPDFLRAATEYLGWPTVRDEIVARRVPTLPRMKRGAFGESLIASILSTFHGYTVPVPKLRFKLSRDQSLPASDVLALRLDGDGNVVEMCLVESKYRAQTDNDVAIQGYLQLQEDYAARIPQIASFVAERLFERSDALFGPFMRYLASRADTTTTDSLRLSLCWEASCWQEEPLVRLDDQGIGAPALSVHVIALAQLKALTDELFAQIGATVDEDDD